MPIPNADLAVVPSAKLLNYLLNPVHPVGGPKAKWFLSLGYRASEPQRLETDLCALLRQSSEILDEQHSAFGVKYTVQGKVLCPRGFWVSIRTVWIIDLGKTQPRLVTAYPDE